MQNGRVLRRKLSESALAFQSVFCKAERRKNLFNDKMGASCQEMLKVSVQSGWLYLHALKYISDLCNAPVVICQDQCQAGLVSITRS